MVFFQVLTLVSIQTGLHVLFMRKWPRVKLDLAEDTNLKFIMYIISGINDKCKHEDRYLEC